LTLGFVLVAAASLPAQQKVPPVAARETAAFMVFTVNRDAAADFEAAWSAIRAGLARVPAADARAFGESLTFYRSDAGQPIALQSSPPEYTLLIDSPSRAFSYNPLKIVNEILLASGVLSREEGDRILSKLRGSVTRIQVRPVVKIG